MKYLTVVSNAYALHFSQHDSVISHVNCDLIFKAGVCLVSCNYIHTYV